MKRTVIVIVVLLAIFLIEPMAQNIKVVNASPFNPSNTSASEYPTPAVPVFSLKFVDNSYRQAGNYIQNKSVEVIIKNQPTFNVFCYNVNSKSNLSENWTTYEYYNNSTYLNPNLFIPNRLLASNSTLTVLVFGFEGNNGSDTYNLILGKVNDGDQLDFQVQAYIGNWFAGKVVNATASIEFNQFNIDAIGDWSPTQTVTVGQSSSVPEFPALAILPLFVVVLIMAFKIRHRKTGKVSLRPFHTVGCTHPLYSKKLLSYIKSIYIDEISCPRILKFRAYH